MLYKYINEKSIQICPQSGYINGRAISNLPRYFANNSDIAKAEGYKKLELNKQPEHDRKNQYLTVVYENTDDTIIQRWIVNDVEQIEEPTDISARIAKLEEELNDLKQTYNEQNNIKSE